MTKKTEDWWLAHLEDLRDLKGHEFAEKYGVHISTVRNQRRLRRLTHCARKRNATVSSIVRKKYKVYPEKIWNYMVADLTNLTITEFCQKYDVSKSTVSSKRKKYNTKPSAKRGVVVSLALQDLIFTDLLAGHDQTAIAKRHGVSLDTVHRLARENKIEGRVGRRKK